MSFFLIEDGRLMLQYPRLSPRERKGFREIDRTFYHQTNCAFFTRFLSHTHPSCRLSILFLQFSKRKKKPRFISNICGSIAYAERNASYAQTRWNHPTTQSFSHRLTIRMSWTPAISHSSWLVIIIVVIIGIPVI